jgi:hypothetical protein
MAGRFEDRKAIGAHAETLLCELLTDSGAIVIAHQQNHDATRAWSGAAVAYGVGGHLHHIPDLEALWSKRGPQSRCFIEAKAKRPLTFGGWGWDKLAFQRAMRWSLTTKAPVFYAIRNTADVPLPPEDRDAEFRDDPDLWSIATVWKLLHSENRSADDKFHYWPASDFSPLRLLLDGGFEVQPVLYLRELVGAQRVPRPF